jgi:hypothetical protein
MDKYFLTSIPTAQELTARIDKWDCIKLKKILYIKGDNYQGDETTYNIGENFCKLFI